LSVQSTLGALEQLLLRWNPDLLDAFNPGLTAQKIALEMKSHRLAAATEDIVRLYAWRNGTALSPALVARRQGLFPAARPFYFIDLEMALGHLGHLRSVATKRVELAAGVNYLPFLWDGSNRWIVISTDVADAGKILSSNHRAAVPFQDLDQSLSLFLDRVVLAITNNVELGVP
jgi:hypothetical protein